MRKLLKYPIFYALLIICAGVALRVVLNIQGWTPTNSDESIMNLMALHIAYRGEHPTFFYGQDYLGAFEAYVGAVLFRIFGPSVLVMRLEMVGFYALFLICLYALLSRLYNCHFVLLMLVFFALGSPYVLQLQMWAWGYPDLPLYVTLLVLVAYSLVRNGDHWSWKQRAAMYGLWGLIVGFVLWQHVLTVPYVFVAGLLLILWRFHDMLRLGLWCIIIGCIMGAWPLIWYNLHALPKHDSLSVALYMTQLGQDARYGIWDHLIVTIVVTIPVATGFSSHCLASHISDHLPLFPTDHPYCIVEQALWGGGYILLLIIADVIAVVMLWRLRHVSQWQIGDRDEAIRQSVRLLLLVAAVLTLVGYVRGNAVNYNTVGSSRYLMCSWLTLPAIFWPLWSAGAYYGWCRGVFPALRIASTLLIGMVLTYGTFGAFSDVPQAQAENSQLEQLATYLQKAGMTRFYSSYWTCDRLIFLSQEKLICGDTWGGTKLRHGCDRYSAYPQMVMASSSPPFVYPVGDVRIQTLERELKVMGISYMHVRVGQYVIYKPSKSLLKTDPLALSC